MQTNPEPPGQSREPTAARAQDEILRPRKGKWALVLLGSAGFVAGGIWMARSAGSSSDRFWGYFCVAFFGLCLVASLVQFIPGSSFLRLGSEGIAVRVMWRTTLYRWADIERFGVAEFNASHATHRMVGLDFSSTYPHRDSAQTLKKMNRRMTGFEAALPDNYGWDYAELAAHLNRLREQYVKSPNSNEPSLGFFR